MRSSGQYKYLHSAVIISGLMLVFGGNTHNDTSMSYGAKCYSSDFLAYDMGSFQLLILRENDGVGCLCVWGGGGAGVLNKFTCYVSLVRV